ncbi:MAG: amino acid permease [Xanthomonadales bacterium]|nr:amino acid permease [Xanthomonadales bacterium]
MPGPENEQPRLKREISQLGFGAIALNGTIGAGIFALPAIAVAQAGLFSPWLYVLCGLLIMAIVFAFARVASYFSDTGGPVTYAGRAFGPFAGFQAGWLLTLSRAAAFAANAHLMVTYAGWFWPPLLDGAWHTSAVLLVCLGLTAINLVGVRQGMLAIFALTVLKLLPLALLILLGLGHTKPDIFTGATIPPIDSLGETMLIVFYAFVGFESALIPAGEGRDARRDIPLALIRTILGITVFYFLIQVVVISVAPDIGGSETPLADIAQLLMGTTGAAILTLGAVFSISGNLTSSMLSAPRLVYAMAHLGSLPAWFGRVHPGFQTPANAIAFYAVFSMILALSGGFVWLAAMSTVVRLLVYVMGIATLPVLHRKLGEFNGQFRLRGGMAVPTLALLLSLWLMTHASLKSWLVTGVFMAAGSVLYFLTRQKRGAPAASRVPPG